ncbi:MAG: hypothetical protein KQH79_11640 [Bacteroidetes bacterium]|nr:hypothetical protein [Bacteroidota bacterium]
MENQEIQKTSSKDDPKLFMDEKSQKFLDETRKWTMFLAIIGFIFIGLIVLMGLIFGLVGSFFGSYLGGFERIAILLVYILIGVLYFFPIYYLMKFSINMKNAIQQGKQQELTSAFEFLKSHYKFIGILTIVALSLYVLLGIVAVIAGAFAAF